MAIIKVTIIAIILCFSVVQGRLIATGKVFPGSQNRDIRSSLNEYQKNAENFIQWMVPGTKWCGDGHIAEDYDDLGIFPDTDRCCRAHDHCDDMILAGETEHGLTNEGKYTRLSCDCDIDFYNCLKTASGNTVSTIVGVGYFNGLAGQCFEETHVATCVEFSRSISQRKGRCTKYEYDETTEKTWQWFDVPRY